MYDYDLIMYIKIVKFRRNETNFNLISSFISILLNHIFNHIFTINLIIIQMLLYAIKKFACFLSNFYSYAVLWKMILNERITSNRLVPINIFFFNLWVFLLWII